MNNADCSQCVYFIYNADEDFHVCSQDMTNEDGECEMFWDRMDAEAEAAEIDKEIKMERGREHYETLRQSRAEAEGIESLS